MDEQGETVASAYAARHRDDDETGDEQEWDLSFHQPPANEVAASVAFDAVLASSDGYVIFCAGLQVYSTGIRLNLELRARDGQGNERLFDAFHGRGPEQVLLGVEFADGRRGRNHGWRGDRSRPADGGVTVTCGGGGGSNDSVDAEFYVAPLPPPGPARLVCAWPARGIGDTVVDLPVEEILEAAARVRQLWPAPTRTHDRPEEPTPPPVPDESWFAG
jgi:hypothetical protein